ncbi:MAG: bifunctional phosphoribosylaminoimidazolecarboxamide formyltransferase/IMP cyclohydrolase [Pseudomonadota bacterium]
MTDLVAPSRALISVSDKTGLADLAQRLAEHDVALASTGGTASLLRDSGLTVTDVSELTGFPEMMDGRVKTLHPGVHGGLLAIRDNPAHIDAMTEHNIRPIDLLVVNLYPFEATVAAGADYAACIENIDIGGPAMIRAAAKNHRFVTIVTDPEDYAALLDEMAQNGGKTRYAFRQRMALNAYARTAAYDAAVSSWLAGALEQPTPRRRAFGGTRVDTLRYGENPHQSAAFYSDGSGRPGVATAKQWQGKALSYNNINDTDAAFELICEFDPSDGPACAIIKHANPCGVAQGDTLSAAFSRAFDCDRTSAFGGIVALNQPLDEATARAILEIFTEVVIAPGASEEARALFAQKKNLRLLTTDALADPHAPMQAWRQVSGGFLLQDKDTGQVGEADLRVVTKRAPSPAQMSDLRFAWRVAKHVKSNAIVYARDGATVGIGAGQMSRVDSALIAAKKAERMADVLGLKEPLTRGCVVASDAFFPVPDGLMEAAAAGAACVIQPGGSMRDDAVIEAADQADLAMVFTGMRHFRH